MKSYRALLAAMMTAAVLLPTTAAAQGGPPPTPASFFQFIHAAPDAEFIDVYLNGRRILDDFRFPRATPFFPLPEGTYKLDLVPSLDRDNSQPLWSRILTPEPGIDYALITIGRLDDGTFEVLMIDEIRRAASVPDQIEYVLVHAAPSLPAIDVRLLHSLDLSVVALLANNIELGDYRGYWRLIPGGYNFEITSADNRISYAIERLEMHNLAGQTIFLMVIPEGRAEAVTVAAVKSDGRILFPFSNATDDAEAVPRAFTLRGNYPNPFTPTTHVTFDLPRAARVHLEVIDLLGRTVLTTPAERIEAGAGRAVAVEAAGLASGVYLYRVVAQTAAGTQVRTGKMVLTH